MADFITTLTSSVTSFLTGIGGGLSSAAEAMFLTGTETKTLSTLGIIIATVGGVGIGLALFNWVKSLLHA
jgi:uncharacterized membrane protein